MSALWGIGGLAVHSSAINRAAMARDIISSPLGLGDLLLLERVSPSRVVLYRSYRATDLRGHARLEHGTPAGCREGVAVMLILVLSHTCPCLKRET